MRTKETRKTKNVSQHDKGIAIHQAIYRGKWLTALKHRFGQICDKVMKTNKYL